MFTTVASSTTMSWAIETTTSTSQRCEDPVDGAVVLRPAIASVATVDLSLREVRANGVEQRHQLGALRRGEDAEDLVHHLRADGERDVAGIAAGGRQLDD